MEAEASTPVVRVHRRQFVIGPRALEAAPGWRSIELAGSGVLSADPELRVQTARDRDGTPWLLLGVAVETRPECAEPAEELARRPTAEVSSLYEGWAGRWVLVGAAFLHPDASAMLSCYYGRDQRGDLWVSSSPALIAQALGVPVPLEGACPVGSAREATSDPWRPSPNATVTGEHRGISYFPPPWSGMPGVRRLLASQTLDLADGEPRPRPIACMPGPELSAADEKELVEALSVGLRTAIERLAALAGPGGLTLLLSGGRDSRMLLSLAAAAGVELRTYTRVHRRASLADRILPARLARLAGYPHHAEHQRRELPGRREAILAHAGYSVSWLSAEEFLHGGSDPLTGIALAGFCAALGRDRFMPDERTAGVTGAEMTREFGEGDAPELVEAFDAWLAWRRQHPEPHLDLSDLFFLEHRTGGRKGSKEQICDLFRFERVPPLNSARLFGLIAALPAPTRVSASWIPELVRCGDPKFLADPMNPPDDYFGFVRAKLLNPRAYRSAAGELLRRIAGRPPAGGH